MTGSKSSFVRLASPVVDDDEAPTPCMAPLPRRAAQTFDYPPIEPLLKLSITVMGCHKASVRIYPGIDLPDVITRAFADAPKEFEALRVYSGIRGSSSGPRPVPGWRKMWDEDLWMSVLEAASGCPTSPEWRAEVVFLGM